MALASVLVLIAVTALLRTAAGFAMGLGIDESYMVAAGRVFRWGYFDHPPAAWWLAWAAAHLAGSSAAAIVRLPFIALFALSTWFMFRLTTLLYSARAGLWAAVVLNIAPVFGVSTGGWVLPDGPLVAGLLGATLCLVHALSSEGRSSDGWWIAAGLWAGLAMFSKYSAVLAIGGAGLFLLTVPEHRRRLLRPGPYLGIAAAVLVFAPVLIWNSRNGWASFAFQAGRADAGEFRPLAPLVTLAGQAAFLLPWIWLPLMVVFVGRLRRGPADARGWLLCCMAAPPIVLFTVVAAWSRNPVLFHWAAPGYLMLVPMLGEVLARRLSGRAPATRAWLIGSGALVVLGLAVVATEVRYNWLPGIAESFTPGHDPDMDAVDWVSLRAALGERGLLGTMPIAALNWHDAGKIDYALGGAATVICLNPDARQYGVNAPLSAYAGKDVLVILRESDRKRLPAYVPDFASMEPLPTITVQHAGRPALPLLLFIGHDLRVEHREAARPLGSG